VNNQQYETDQRIRAAVRKRVQAIVHCKSSIPRSVIADDALDVLEPLTLKTESGRLTKVFPALRRNPETNETELVYAVLEDPS
jgi:hypothetical protein